MNILSATPTKPACDACKDGYVEPFPFTMAFQPIVDVVSQTVYAYEALVRGLQGETAFSILSQVTEENRYAFDQGCRVKAIELAARLGIAEQGACLSVNFMPGAVYSPAACIQRTLKAARATGFPLDKLIFEITEDERVKDTGHLQGIVTEYRRHGFALALDDFGAGYASLNHLAELDIDTVKLDMRLLRDLDKRPRSAKIVTTMVAMCRSLNVHVVAEGIETVEEYGRARACGVTLMQGYLFARPLLEGLPEVTWPETLSQPVLPLVYPVAS